MSHPHETSPTTIEQEPDISPAEKVDIAIRGVVGRYGDSSIKANRDNSQPPKMTLYSVDTRRSLVTTELHFDNRSGVVTIDDEDEGQKISTDFRLGEDGKTYQAMAIDRRTNQVSPSDPDYLLRLADKITWATPTKTTKGKLPPSPSRIRGDLRWGTDPETAKKLERKDSQDVLTEALDIAFARYEKEYMLPPVNGSDQLTISAPFRGKPALLTCVRTFHDDKPGHRSVMLTLRLGKRDKDIHYWRLDSSHNEASYLAPYIKTGEEDGRTLVEPYPELPPGSKQADPNDDLEAAFAAKELMDMLTGDPVKPHDPKKFGQGLFKRRSK